MATHVLIIDDDASLIALLKKYLALHGIEVLGATHPDAGIRLLLAERPDLVILDVMLPDRDGFKVCLEIREKGETPVIMLTARGEVADRVVGFEMGADDYLPKPFEPRELLARIQAVLKRSAARPGRATETLHSGRLTLDPAAREVRMGGKTLELTTTEFDILRLLLENPGVVLSRERILEGLHGAEPEAFNRSVDLAVSRLRQKLGDSPERQKWIKTVWAGGYLFAGKVERRAS